MNEPHLELKRKETPISKSMLESGIANYQKINQNNSQSLKKTYHFKHIHQDQRDRGIIHNIMPTKRDNPCIEFVQNFQTINDKESRRELNSVLIVMGGDRF
jgi:hypothetical protein